MLPLFFLKALPTIALRGIPPCTFLHKKHKNYLMTIYGQLYGITCFFISTRNRFSASLVEELPRNSHELT